MKNKPAAIEDIRNFDIFLMSYDEPRIAEKLENLRKVIPHIKNIHGVKGEFNAWREAARQSSTPYFVSIDADTDINSDFSFRIFDLQADDRRVHVWRSRNAVNGLVYGHGSIHLFNKQHLLDFPGFDGVDFTLGAATKGHCIQEECATTTNFNVNPFLSWRAGFKEATKLASETNTFPGSKNNEHSRAARLKVWCSLGADSKYGSHCILGARMGAYFGFKHRHQGERTYIIKNYQLFNKMWNWWKIENRIDELTSTYKKLLAEKNNFTVVDFDEQQSQWVKSIIYRINHDVIERVLCKYNSPLLIEY